MSDFQNAFDIGRQQGIKTIEVEGVMHALIPPDCTLQSFEQLMAAPSRIKASPMFEDVAGFKAYIDDFKETGSRIFVDETTLSFTTIFDCHHKDAPAWGDHSATLGLKKAHEWERFKQADNKKMAAQDFAEFIEDNLAYITGPVTGVELLSMAQNLKVDLKGDLQVEQTMQAGLRTLTIRDDSTLSGKSGAKEMAFPEKLTLTLRIFKNHTPYEIEVFLRFRVTKEAVTFWIKIPDIIGIEEAAFNQVIADVAEATQLPTLKGAYKARR